MFSLASLIGYYLWPRKVGNNLRAAQHRHDHPYDAWAEGWYPEYFPKSAIFLDTMWSADKSYVDPRLRNNTQSGLREMPARNWMFVDKDRFKYEMMLAKTMMREDFSERDKMLITR